ncbi:uncharacterized protein BCR38DRAFT_495595 [Pseudomassariella vexata]|uniref:Rhodopsin domain-containing protein n=1 Tax=Pseudomassariella vexata TaxID=1141098 RepID=A0A1Y2DR27_9PEZI|nr:uncharacterized protein BCR38DRAFT_495595 [Pseudomassariella vexata]ORY61753.1 hypothetical protein BCR38DRAFT_495595 [Pseudomassariella vexata]
MLISSPSVQLERDNTYLPEVWTWYAIGVTVILLRFAVRIRIFGIRGLQGDDYLSILAFVLYTVNVVIVQITYYTGGNIDVDPNGVSLSQEDIRILTLGSKMEFASWYSYPGTLKFTVLLFYKRLTLGVMREKTLHFLLWACGTSYLALALSVSFTCRPYSHNWQIQPLPGPECTFRPQNFWILVVLNVTTDAAIMSIPIPMFWQLRTSLRRKIGLMMLFSSGIFIISTAIVRAVLTIGGKPSVININRWGFRETAVGLIAVTAPVLVPLFRRSFWQRGDFVRHRHRGHEIPPHKPRNPEFGHWLGTLELREVEEGQHHRPMNSAGAAE